MFLTTHKSASNLNDLFNSFWNSAWPAESADPNTRFTPTAYVSEQDGKHMVEVELPGVKKEDISIHVEAGVLTIKASRKRGETEIQFERRFRLAEDLAVDNIAASHENGLLVLSISRKAEAAPKRIEIR